MKVKLIHCKFCGGKLPTRNKVFCSILCSRKNMSSTKNAKKVKIECSNCKKLVFKTREHIKITKNPTCSRSCAAVIRSKLTSGIKKSPETIAKQNLAKTKNKIIKYGIFECKKCKKKFPSNTSLRGHHGWCNNKNIKTKCEACGTKFNNTTSCKIHQKMWCEVLVPQKKKALCEKLGAALYQNVQL